MNDSRYYFPPGAVMLLMFVYHDVIMDTCDFDPYSRISLTKGTPHCLLKPANQSNHRMGDGAVVVGIKIGSLSLYMSTTKLTPFVGIKFGFYDL